MEFFISQIFAVHSAEVEHVVVKKRSALFVPVLKDILMMLTGTGLFIMGVAVSQANGITGKEQVVL
jgi:hypothetical protein